MRVGRHSRNIYWMKEQWLPSKKMCASKMRDILEEMKMENGTAGS